MMVETIGNGTAICINCGHQLWYDTSNEPAKWKHFTRAYREHGYPYSTNKCYGPLYSESGARPCGCVNPEPFIEDNVIIPNGKLDEIKRGV